VPIPYNGVANVPPLKIKGDVMEEIIKELKQLSESLYDEHQYTWSDQVDEIIEKLRTETAKSGRNDLLVSGKFAEALEEVKRIIDRMDIDIFDNESVGKDAYYQIHTSINEAKRQINEVISKFSR